jgi:FSR family fosmidomycin resistance protein-like MFS transporter
LFVDHFRAPVFAAVSGILLVAISTLALQVPTLATVIAGLGNALFHVGGGFTSLNLAPGKAALPGIYVAPGALGLMIGIWIGKSGTFIAWPFILLLVISVLLILAMPRPKIDMQRRLPANLKWFETIILLLLFSIAIRGLVGLGLDLPWKSSPALLVVLTCAVVLGKSLGGILADRYGWIKVATAGLLISAPLLAFFPHIPAVAMLGVFLFNLTMPVTLACLAEMLPGKSGFAFGLTALALIIGAWPVFTNLRFLASDHLLLFCTILMSTVVLYLGLRLYVQHYRATDTSPLRRE